MVVSNIFLFLPLTLGKLSNLTVAYFLDGWFNHQPGDDEGCCIVVVNDVSIVWLITCDTS